MSTSVSRFSAAKLHVGTAALVAVVAAATFTPAMAQAAPQTLAPITQAWGNTVESLLNEPIVNPAILGEAPAFAAAAVNSFQPFWIIDGVVKLVAGASVAFLNLIGNTLKIVGDTVLAVANAIAVIFRVGPYNTAG